MGRVGIRIESGGGVIPFRISSRSRCPDLPGDVGTADIPPHAAAVVTAVVDVARPQQGRIRVRRDFVCTLARFPDLHS